MYMTFKLVYISGWGKNEQNIQPQELQKLDLNILSDENQQTCKNELLQLQFVVSDNVLCAKSSSPDEKSTGRVTWFYDFQFLQDR